MEKYFDSRGEVNKQALEQAEGFAGYTCLFSTARLNREDTIRFYFDKDMVENAFCSLEGIRRLRPCPELAL